MDALIWAMVVVGVLAIIVSVVTFFVKNPIVTKIGWALVGIVALVVFGKALIAFV